MAGTILIVDDEEQLAQTLAKILRKQGYTALCAHDAASGRQALAEHLPDVALIDLRLPDADGSALLRELKHDSPSTQFVVITAYGSIRSAVEATRHGAVDYLTKPFEPAEVLLAVQSAMQQQALRDEVARLRAPRRQSRVDARGCKSAAMRRVYDIAERAAGQDGIVLLLGESGTGKDHLARWIHSRSRRSNGPYFALNCAALSRELAESELFGHEPGAFTGTRGRKRGLLELAQSGTLLLNEIGELDAGLQAKLLSFLDTRTFVRVGGEQSIGVDARILAATNRDLRREVKAGRFREDLFYRLNVLPITLPPLRERAADISMLIDELLGRLTEEMGLSHRPQIDAEALMMLGRYPWPGNIRELRNVLERTLILSDDLVVRARHLDLSVDTSGQWKLEVTLESGRSLHEITHHVAASLVAEALRRAPTKKEAAELLGISRHALAHQVRTLGIKA